MPHDTQGRYSEAEPLYKRVLAIDEKALGPDHPDVAQFLNNLAFLAVGQRNWAQAADYWRRATEIIEHRAERGLAGSEGSIKGEAVRSLRPFAARARGRVEGLLAHGLLKLMEAAQPHGEVGAQRDEKPLKGWVREEVRELRGRRRMEAGGPLTRAEVLEFIYGQQGWARRTVGAGRGSGTHSHRGQRYELHHRLEGSRPH